MKTMQDFIKAIGISYNAIEKRMARKNVKPVKIEKRKKYYSEEDFYKIVYYDFAKPNSVETQRKNRAGERDIYRVSIKVLNENCDYVCLIKHIGLTKQQALELVKDYEKQGIEARAIKCIFKDKTEPTNVGR